MRYDVVIIGGGLAGLTCGIRLQEQGKRCAIVSAGQSALHFSSGSLDLLSALPDGTAVMQPVDALAALAEQAPQHPYTLMGKSCVTQLIPEAEALLSRSGLWLRGEGSDNHQRMTPLGKWRPCWLSPADSVTRGLAGTPEWRNPLVAGIDGFLDFQSRMVAGELQAQGIAAHSGDLKLPVLDRLRQNPSEFRAVNLARVLDQPASLVGLTEELMRLSHDNDAVILPACVGLESSAPLEQLRRALGKPVGLLPTLPPSLLGLRLYHALLSRFRLLGGMFMPGDRVLGSVQLPQDVAIYTHNHGDIPLHARRVVLASGSFFSNGLVAEFDQVSEPVFGLDVYFHAQREDWSQSNVFAVQPYLQFGVITDNQLHPYIKGQTQPNLYAIGAVLQGFDPLQQGCGAGVSILSALYVADAVLMEDKQ
ncbi:glycerol-3-phosphate dehydrogenase subunit GlpB [Brenneria uluponensis]|uniref:glycerol-3-phosphate dehydrogenase subunit GlpB n=1 Tax=Brenneria uluponensis TaxID=3057057 RepID=UPI0028E1EB24|nr:glycerol-3-phosphate dehydrogenase subunit GlpB [Brenneria ulupoensis]